MQDFPRSADRPLLSVVVPVFNEKANVRPLVGEIVEALDGLWPYEIVFVDDGSEDGTAETLAGLATSTRLALRCLHHDCRRGQSQAVVSGVRAARGAWIATLDGDGQNPPADIPAMLAELIAANREDPDAVCIAGIRARRQDSWMKRVSSRLANAVRKGLLHDGVSDTGCGLKVFRRDAFLALPLFDHVHRFIPALFQFCGGRVLTQPVGHRPRRSGESKYGTLDRLWAGLYDLVGVRWLRRRAIFRPWQQSPL